MVRDVILHVISTPDLPLESHRHTVQLLLEIIKKWVSITLPGKARFVAPICY